MNNLEKQLNKETLHEKDSKSDLSVIKVQFDKFLHSEEVKTSNYDGRHEVKVANTSSGNTDSSRFISDNGKAHSSENDCSNTGNDQISKKQKLMAEVYSNTTPDSTDMCNNEFKDDQNADDHEDERIVLANLNAILKLDIDEKKKNTSIGARDTGFRCENQAKKLTQGQLWRNLPAGVTEDTFSGNKNDDAHEHVERVLDIVSLFNIPGVSHDDVMICVFPITLIGAAKRYCPPSKTAKQLEEIRNFKQEGDETLYQAWEGIMTCLINAQLTTSIAIKRNIDSSSNSEGIVVIVSKLDSLGRDMKKLKENVHAIPVGCQTCGGAHLHKECPLNEEVKSVEEVKYGEFRRSSPFNNGAKYRQLTKEFHAKTASEVNNSSFSQCKAVYANKEAPLDNTINKPHEVSFVSDNSIQEAQEEGVSSRVLPCQLPCKELNPGIVENVLVKINKFLFLSDFVVIDMLNTRNETMILRRPFQATIHAKIDVLNKEFSLGIRDDRVTFDMDKKIHNFTTPIGKVYMINSIHNNEPSTSSNAPTDKSLYLEKSNNLHNENSYDNYMQERSREKTRMLKSDTNIPSAHFCKPFKQICNGILNVWPTCDPTMKVGHTEVSEPVKKALLKTWLVNCFQEELVKDPRSRSFNDYMWVFDLEIDQLADKYELGIGKKGHMLDVIWENCKKVQGDHTYWWHDHGIEENERRESGLDMEEYALPKVLIAWKWNLRSP
ncbi:hypothetical protein Tco_1447081 [Tanacetum coccineum]